MTTGTAVRGNPDSPVTRRERTVLIVDDDGPSRLLLTIVCDARGLAVIEAASGAEALSVAVQRRPDLILLDVSLPDMSGLEVCRQVRGAGMDVPILMLSGHADPADVERALQLGADGYLTKPFVLRELFARMDKHLGWDGWRAA
jgi:DNA-binding response OmpR family regulator